MFLDHIILIACLPDEKLRGHSEETLRDANLMEAVEMAGVYDLCHPATNAYAPHFPKCDVAVASSFVRGCFEEEDETCHGYLHPTLRRVFAVPYD